MRIPSGVTDQYLYFVALDASGLYLTGLSSFTVRRSRNGAASAAFTTPTINETDVTNMPGYYELLLDEDMTIGAGNVSEEVALRITATGMRSVSRTFELYDSSGSAPTAAAIADAVWDEAQADHVTAGSFGITASEIADILVDTAEIGAAGAGLTAINLPNQTMDIVGNITGNLSGSVGSVTGAVGSVTAGVTLAASAVQAIWDALTSALTTAGSIGKLLVDNVNATISSRSTHAAADVWSVATRLLTAGTNIVLAKGTGVTGFTDLSAAAVNAEVVDALNVDTYAEPGQGAPAATASIAAKLGWLFAAFRNKKTVTATTHSLFADDGTTVITKSTVSDDATTFTETEKISGP